MTALRITNFGGIIPRMAPRQLPGQSAQAAGNVSLLPGELRPMRKPRQVFEPDLLNAQIQSIYRLDDETWFVWPTAHVQMERAPIEGEARYVFTGDGPPKITTKALATPVSAAGAPAAAHVLGIPKPLVAPSVSQVSGTGATVSRFYLYTFYSDWNEEGQDSPVSAMVTGTTDGTWTISGMDAAPPNSGSVSAATHLGGVVTVTLGSGNHYLRAGDQVTIGSVVGMTDLNGVWPVASVPAANQITISLNTAQTYTSGGTWARVHAWGTCTKRIYRSAGTGGQFQLVAEGVTGTSYTDTLLDTQIPGDDLISQAFEPPPVNLTGLVAMPNGMLAGFIEGGRTVCFCEPYQPHAWPTVYQKKVNEDVMGIASFDTNLGVATKGYPVVLTGVDPAQMSLTRHVKAFPCLSRDSVCSTGDAIVFATKNGLARADLTGAGLFTESLFTPEGWNALIPTSMKCAFDGARLFVHTETANRIFIMNLVEGGDVVNSYQSLTCLASDRSTGDIYFASAIKVYRFDSFDTAPQTTDWWSKEFLTGTPANLGAAKVEFDEEYRADALEAIEAERDEVIAANQVQMASPAGGRGAWGRRAFNTIDWNGSVLDPLPDMEVRVGFTYYANGKMVYSVLVPDQRVFRLPDGYKVDTFSVRVQSNTQVRAILVGDTPKSLAEA